MSTEYDPLFKRSPASEVDDLERVQDRFAEASGPYLSTPWPWFAWGLVLPSAALATPLLYAGFGAAGVLLLWSGAVLLGGVTEALLIWRRRGAGTTPLSGWVFRAQGNLSLVAVVLSGVLVWKDLAGLLPAVWLLLLGHSLFAIGGLAFRPMRTCGLLYQIAGVGALLPAGNPLVFFAAGTAAGNLWMAVSIWRRQRARRQT